MSGETAAYYGKRMRAELLSRTGRTWGAMSTFNELLKSNPKDAGVLVQLGDVNWVQTYIETSIVTQHEFLARASAYHWEALQDSPKATVPAERLRWALSLLEKDDVQSLEDSEARAKKDELHIAV